MKGISGSRLPVRTLPLQVPYRVSRKSDQVLSLAELYFPKKVVNLLEVEVPLDVTLLKCFPV